jgi:SAM-dependent methyltransferase
MSSEKRPEFFWPENLLTQEKQVKQKSPESLELNDKKGDFGSYRWLLHQGAEDSLIEQHNMISPRAKIYAQFISKVIGRQPGSIADIGCGAGFVAHELKERFPASKVVGYELSADAIEYARSHWPEVEFHCWAIFPDTDLGMKFDMIHCQEFYPFTRTSKVEYYRDYLAMFSRHLNDGGIIVITLRKTEDCILNALPQLGSLLGEAGLSPVYQKLLLPSLKVYATLRNIGLASLITRFLRTNHSYLLMFNR